ncbi:MAG TPA: ABC transporter substrate-binding protein, partial [Roseiflexaceae bacterium]|nr:ABC transporter substrate-binding protein [Roseiflexaceae bacterium]
RNVSLSLLLGLLMALLAACGGAPQGSAPAATTAPTTDSSSGAATAAPEPTTAAEATTAPEPTAAEATTAPAGDTGGEVSREDTLIYAVDQTDIITLDPAVAYESGSILPSAQMYETLVSFNPGEGGKLVPLLAESWDVAEAGEQWTITFKLDPDAKFANGNPVTADDVVFSWGRAIDINKSPVFLLTDVCQIAKENLAATDAATLTVKIPKAVSPSVCLSVLTFSVSAVLEKAALEPNLGSDLGETWLNDHSAGSGPYVLNKWERSVNVTLDANQNYWGGTVPAMKRVIIQNTPELANLQAAIETGDADIVEGLGTDQTAVLEGNADLTLVKGQSTGLAYLGMNATKPPFDKNDVREAIRYAINYDDIVALLGGNADVVQEIIPKGFLGHTGNNPFTQDIDKAKELLAQAGVAEGTEVELLIATGNGSGGIEWATLGAKIKDDIEKTGLVVNIQQLQGSELLNRYRAQDTQMVLYSWGPDFPDPDGNATPFANYEAKSLAWRNAWEDQKAIDMSKAAAVEQDPAKRTEMYKELVDYIQHNGPYALLYEPNTIFGVRSNVEGFVYDPTDTPTVSFWLISKK